MYGLNVDPRNPQGNPTPLELGRLGVQRVRFTFKDGSDHLQPEPVIVQFYRRQLKALTKAGIESLVVLSHETCPNRPPFAATDEVWATYVAHFAARAAEIAKVLARWRPAFQIWQAPDAANEDHPATAMPATVYGRLLDQTYRTIKRVDAGLSVITAGLVSGQPAWLAQVQQGLGGALPADALALHPYTKRPEPEWPDPEWGSGYVGDLITTYQQVAELPIWLTEIGVDTLDETRQAEYLRRFYQTIATHFAAKVEWVFWFCYSDGMAYPFGLVDTFGQPKPAYQVYQERAGSPEAVHIAATTTVSLDRLHEFTPYLEQNIVFGMRHYALEQQQVVELGGRQQQLSKADIWRLMNKMLTGSPHTIEQPELDALYQLQRQKDLQSTLRSIVLTTHQKTGALSGRLGVHSRISAESEPNAIANIEATMQVLSHVQPGQRMIVMDMVKASADEYQLRAPDIFETNIYGRHRNGLIENHAWNLQKLVRAIRDRGYEDRVILMIRLDGPDDGANVNPFDPASLVKYELAIAKLLRYLETVLPTVPFKIVLGNEPDLLQERKWSDPQADPRIFTLNQFAPAIGAFLKRMAQQRPDVTFICPALSANLKNDQLTYYTAMFGEARPDNLVPAMHGYAADVATLPVGQKNLLEQQAEVLLGSGKFRYISATEIGSGDPFSDTESLSEKGRFADVIAWLLLSTEHQTSPGQDNHWNFRINPSLDDPLARGFADIVNRSKNRVLRNIREHDGVTLQIMRNQPVDRPAYGVTYVSHNTPTTMSPGQIQTVQLTLRNPSHRTWFAGGSNPVRLGYHWYTRQGEALPAEQWPDYRTQLPRDIPADGLVTLTARLGSPQNPGSYEVRWDLVEEQKTWFAWQGTPTLNVPIIVDYVPAPAEFSLSASHNNRLEGANNLLQAIDQKPQTRWSSRAPQQPGMWFQIDLREVRSISRVYLNSDQSPQDYPRGYRVRLGLDGQNWTTVAENPANGGPLDVQFAPRQARYIRIDQTGRDEVYWWSINEVVVTEAAAFKLTVRASHNNVSSGADNLIQALDGRPETRWSSRSPQRPGMWFEVDLGTIRTVRGLRLDSAGSTNDYPRGYVVRLSTNRTQWQEVARRDQNVGAIDLTFSPQAARYLRIEQTGQAEQWWWSIHQVVIKE